jgi:uncharacterized protein YwgA
MTSAIAYRTIKDSGLLSEMRWRVYDILYHHGPLLGSQVSALYKRDHLTTSYSETVRNRITELRDLGVVIEVGHAIDPITKMSAILWDVTDQLPQKKLEKKESSKQKIKRLEQRITQLEGEKQALEIELHIRKNMVP